MNALFSNGLLFPIVDNEQYVLFENRKYDIIEDQNGNFYIIVGGEVQYFSLEADDLKEYTYHRNPTQSEVNFGHGAIHYRDFTAAEIGLNSRGELKKWFKADDGLRYYY